MTSDDAYSGSPTVACSSSGQNVYLAWRGDKSGNAEIYVRRTTDYGESWGPVAKLTSNSGVSSSPAVSCSSDGEYVYLAWEDDSPGNSEIYFRRSVDYGQSWNSTVKLTANPGNSVSPSLACSGSGQYVYLVWMDDTPGNYKIYLRRSTEYGDTWSSSTRMSSSVGNSIAPSVTCSSGGQYVYLAWADLTTGNFEILSKRSTNYGA